VLQVWSFTELFFIIISSINLILGACFIKVLLELDPDYFSYPLDPWSILYKQLSRVCSHHCDQADHLGPGHRSKIDPGSVLLYQSKSSETVSD